MIVSSNFREKRNTQIEMNLISFIGLYEAILTTIEWELILCSLDFSVGKAVQGCWVAHGGELLVWL